MDTENKIPRINHWYGNMKTGKCGDYIENGSFIPGREDISLRITQDTLTHDDAIALIGFMDVMFLSARCVLDEAAGLSGLELSERMEFRLTKDEMKLLDKFADREGITKSGFLRAMIHSTAGDVE